MGKKYLIVVGGPTGVGKSDLSIALARRFSAPIVSCDSRQLYREMTIGTAVPTPEQLGAVKHYFIHSHSIETSYSSGDYEREVLPLLKSLFAEGDVVLMVGGTGLYIDAVCNGIDVIPDAGVQVREAFKRRVAEGEFHLMQQELKEKDPKYYEEVDIANVQRVTRALEVIEVTGKPYSSFRTGERVERDFEVIRLVLYREREELYARINARVEQMMTEGLLDEALSLYDKRRLNALQTVGYREFFDYKSGIITLEEAVELLKRNSRRYAKRQLTWFRRDKSALWLLPSQFEEMTQAVKTVEEIKEYGTKM